MIKTNHTIDKQFRRSDPNCQTTNWDCSPFTNSRERHVWWIAEYDKIFEETHQGMVKISNSHNIRKHHQSQKHQEKFTQIIMKIRRLSQKGLIKSTEEN